MALPGMQRPTNRYVQRTEPTNPYYLFQKIMSKEIETLEISAADVYSFVQNCNNMLSLYSRDKQYLPVSMIEKLKKYVIKHNQYANSDDFKEFNFLFENKLFFFYTCGDTEYLVRCNKLRINHKKNIIEYRVKDSSNNFIIKFGLQRQDRGYLMVPSTKCIKIHPNEQLIKDLHVRAEELTLILELSK